jgi:glycosyltransferase involved in cell wall biosynthesis
MLPELAGKDASATPILVPRVERGTAISYKAYMSPLPRPFVSVILPCRNERGHIEASLRSVLNQEPPQGGFEIIVADGVSTDGTREYLQELAARHSKLRVLTNGGRIVSRGLNAAIRAARGEVIVRMDAHTIYAPDYIKQCLKVLEETGADNVGGPMRTRAEAYTERAIRAAFHSPYAVGGARSHSPDYEGYVDTVIYGCWKKEVFSRVGYFDEELVRNQDDEHNLRIVRAGGKVYQSRQIRSAYQVRGSLAALFAQYMQYGYWKVLVIRKHDMPASLRHLVPGAFVASLIVSILLAWFWSPGLWVTAALAGWYAAFIAFASVVTAAKTEWALLPLLPVVFGCFHFGYGYGFLRGIIDFVVFHNAPNAKFVQLTRN